MRALGDQWRRPGQSLGGRHFGGLDLECVQLALTVTLGLVTGCPQGSTAPSADQGQTRWEGPAQGQSPGSRPLTGVPPLRASWEALVEAWGWGFHQEMGLSGQQAWALPMTGCQQPLFWDLERMPWKRGGGS